MKTYEEQYRQKMLLKTPDGQYNIKQYASVDYSDLLEAEQNRDTNKDMDKDKSEPDKS